MNILNKIYIDQRAIIENNINLDLIDLAIYDYIKFTSNSKDVERYIDPNLGLYFYIDHMWIIQWVPLIKITTKQGVIKRIQNLEREGLIIRHPDCDRLKKTYYKFGDKYDLLETTVHHPKNSDRVILDKNKEIEVMTIDTNNTSTLSENNTSTLSENLGNNNNIYNNNINNNTGEWKKSFEIYMQELKVALKEIITPEYIKEREIYHPNLDIIKSLKKAYVDYWGTQAGWKNKKSKKIKGIDWKATFNNALSQKMNQVYKDRSPTLFGNQSSNKEYVNPSFKPLP